MGPGRSPTYDRLGSQWKAALLSRISSTPIQNVGIDSPISASRRARTSSHELRRTAERTPSGTATSVETSVAPSASSTVYGSGLQEQRCDRQARAKRVAQVAAQQVAQPAQVLLVHRIGQAEHAPQGLLDLWRHGAFLADPEGDRIARDEANQGEHEHRQRQRGSERGNHLAQRASRACASRPCP